MRKAEGNDFHSAKVRRSCRDVRCGRLTPDAKLSRRNGQKERVDTPFAMRYDDGSSRQVGVRLR